MSCPEPPGIKKPAKVCVPQGQRHGRCIKYKIEHPVTVFKFFLAAHNTSSSSIHPTLVSLYPGRPSFPAFFFTFHYSLHLHRFFKLFHLVLFSQSFLIFPAAFRKFFILYSGVIFSSLFAHLHGIGQNPTIVKA